MPSKPIDALVEPRVLKWARESMGLTIATVAARLHVSPALVAAWEEERARPNVNHLSNIARIYKRPSAVFFFPEPPSEPPLPADFRLPSIQEKVLLSEKTRLAIRRARRVQAIARELAENLDRPFVSGIQPASLSDTPEGAAARTRKLLAVTPEAQFSWKSEAEALEHWKAAVERLGVLVFSVGLPADELSGLSLPAHGVPAILVNAREPGVRQIFTLFHELCHLALGKGGICEIAHSEDWHSWPGSEAHSVEPFCNRFAGALLVPKEALRAEGQIPIGHGTVPEEALDSLAYKFKVSQEAILLRLVRLNLASREFYQRKKVEWGGKGEPPHPFRLPPAAGRCVRQKGVPFLSLVLENERKGRITRKDVADYLETRLDHVPSIEAMVASRTG